MRRIAAFAAVLGVTVLAAVNSGAQAATSFTKPISVGISGGVAVPNGDFASGTSGGFTGVNTGYNITGSIAVALPVLPFEIRGDAAYDGFGTKNGAFANGPSGSYNADARVFSLTANIVYPFPIPTPIVRPYIIGGIGDYNVRLSPTVGGSVSQSDFGYNIGAGIKVALVGFNGFIEARYHHANQDRPGVSFTPITVGIMF
jgi:hypothetical protein